MSPLAQVSSPLTPTRSVARNRSATDPVLRAELLAMLAADQNDRRSPDSGVAGDQQRTERLRAIVHTRGWPTRTLVGDDGATAAWAITQHSDLDPQFQREMLTLMRAAAAAGEASPGDVAYLTDRVAANAGEPQTYGTQMGCSENGEPLPAPLADPERVDELRSAAGLPPLADYVAEMEKACAES